MRQDSAVLRNGRGRGGIGWWEGRDGEGRTEHARCGIFVTSHCLKCVVGPVTNTSYLVNVFEDRRERGGLF